MANTSATGGYIVPAAESPPLTDDALDAVFQADVVNITGLSGTLVRPRWQPVPPKHPEPTVDWCAIGITEIAPDDSPSIRHVGTGDGSDNMVRHDQITLLCTFHGPLAMRYAAKLRDGIGILQNTEALALQGIKFIESSPIRSVPELYNQQWIKRFDIALIFRRKVDRMYPILNILSADPILVTDTIIVTETGD